MKTRPYLLIVLCILVSKTTLFAQSVPNMPGWDMDEKGGAYSFKPLPAKGAAPADTREFTYEIMAAVKGEGQSIEDWFSSAIDKDIQTAGFTLPAATASKKNITTNQTIISFSTELTDKKGKAWFVTYVGYQAGSGDNRLARIISSPDMKYFISHMRPVADHFNHLAQVDASSTSSIAKAGRGGHGKPDNNRPTPQTNTTSEGLLEKGLRTPEINGILIHLEYNTTADGKMVRIYKPYLVLNDGTIYSEPVTSPYSFDVAASKLKEPKKWGTWKLKNNSFMVEWTARNENEKWFKNWFWATPSQREEKLEGTFMTVNGLENDAIKSTEKGASKFIAFNNNGQFTLTTGDANNTSVANSDFNKKNEAGTYTLGDYSIELHFNNGTTLRRIFYFYLQGKTHFGVGNSVYVPKQFNESASAN